MLVLMILPGKSGRRDNGIASNCGYTFGIDIEDKPLLLLEFFVTVLIIFLFFVDSFAVDSNNEEDVSCL